MNDSDRRKRRASIGLESLEGRRVLSTSTGAGMIAPIAADLVRGTSYIALSGTVHGLPSRSAGIPDVGASVTLRGLGNVHGVGLAKVTGSLHGTGFIASGHVQGTITLAGGKGSLTLQLQGPAVGGFTAPGSGTYSYSVLKGTGAFKHEVGAGTVALNLAARSFTMTFHAAPNRA